MRRLAAILCLLAAPAWAADPDVCYFGTPPAGAPVSPYSDENPFLGLEQVLGNLYVNRALCGVNVGADQKFWRSYYEEFGCSRESDAGRTIELWLADSPYHYADDFRAFRDRYPEIQKERCEMIAKCEVPERFSLTERGFITCPEAPE